MSQQLMAALEKDLGSVPNILIRGLTTPYNSSFEASDVFFHRLITWCHLNSCRHVYIYSDKKALRRRVGDGGGVRSLHAEPCRLESLFKAAGNKATKKFHSVSRKHLSPETATKSLRSPPSPVPCLLNWQCILKAIRVPGSSLNLWPPHVCTHMYTNEREGWRGSLCSSQFCRLQV